MRLPGFEVSVREGRGGEEGQALWFEFALTERERGGQSPVFEVAPL